MQLVLTTPEQLQTLVAAAVAAALKEATKTPTRSADERELMTAEQVGKRLGKCAKTVRNWCQDGRLKAIDTSDCAGKASWRVRPADLEDFLRARRR